MKTKLILAGGFLGAGKTTLLYEAAKELIAEGHKTGLITNDQAADLVDTVYLSKTGAGIEEVSGSCFCCNFPGFAEAIRSLRENGAEYIIAEPVGSCTDLSATILQPLKDKYADQLELSPFTVLIDPKRLKEILAGRNSGLAESGAYIIRKQLEEADVIAINKADTLTEAEAELLLVETRKTYPGAEVMTISAKTEGGAAAWLAYEKASSETGKSLAKVDYDTYAEGEAVLGWLNATIELTAEDAPDWNHYADTLLTKFLSRFKEEKAAIGHVKLLLDAPDHFIMGNLTGSKEAISVRGTASEEKNVVMTLNARVQTNPERLEEMIREELAVTDAATDTNGKILRLRCLMPGRPNPTYHYEKVI